MGRTAIVVPVKSIFTGKSRLKSVLDNRQRERLNRFLLERTVSICRQVVEKDQLFIVSKCEHALSIVRDIGEIIVEEGEGLNTALEQASQKVLNHGFNRLLVLPCDLFKIASTDLRKLFSQEFGGSEVIIIADKKNEGTNALFLNGVNKFKFCFGPNSFQLHQEQAQGLSCSYLTLRNTNFAFDLDTKEDYRVFHSFADVNQDSLRGFLVKSPVSNGTDICADKCDQNYA